MVGGLLCGFVPGSLAAVLGLDAVVDFGFEAELGDGDLLSFLFVFSFSGVLVGPHYNL